MPDWCHFLRESILGACPFATILKIRSIQTIKTLSSKVTMIKVTDAIMDFYKCYRACGWCEIEKALE